jgi:hypothetical protein
VAVVVAHIVHHQAALPLVSQVEVVVALDLLALEERLRVVLVLLVKVLLVVLIHLIQ